MERRKKNKHVKEENEKGGEKKHQTTERMHPYNSKTIQIKLTGKSATSRHIPSSFAFHAKNKLVNYIF